MPVEKLQAKNSKSNVFTVIGAFDEEKIVLSWSAFNKYMEEKNLSNLHWFSNEYKDQTHSSVLPVAITDGLKKLLNE